MRVESEFTPEQEKEILRASEESSYPANLVGPFSNAADLIASLRSGLPSEQQPMEINYMKSFQNAYFKISATDPYVKLTAKQRSPYAA
jgi:hypothetical protein